MILSTNSGIYKTGSERDRIERIAALGFTAIAFDGPPGKDWTGWEETLQPFEYLSCHSTFVDLMLLSSYPAIREVTLGEIKHTFDVACRLGSDTNTIHSGITSPRLSEEQTDALMKEMTLRIDQEAQSCGVWACWETGTGYFVPLARFDLIRELSLAKTGICLDTGHNMRVWTQVNPGDSIGTFAEFIHRYGDLIEIVHVHDWIEPAPREDGWNDHHMVGGGEINWQEVFSSLVEVGYDGELCLEYHPDSFTDEREFMANVDYVRRLIREAGATVV